MKLSTLLTVLSALFGTAAAILWFVSALVKTPDSFNIYVVRPHGAMPLGSVGGTYLGQGQSPDLTALGSALRRQSKFSALAAGCAGISAFLQTVSLAV
jgi:uncharacterized protein YjfI (DUF2170 family)